jgi:hypothetical protein
VICVGASEGPAEALAAPWERIGGRGRKLQALDGRRATSWYICEISDCCVCVSCCCVSSSCFLVVELGETHELGVKLG